jgi:regulatory associated protein of mTOR
MCLNIGTEPLDVKPDPCATLQCWIDPKSMHGSLALKKIGKKLQQQYETLSMRARYRLFLDPPADEFEEFCKTQRRLAKSDRVLFHYNGHGVPMTTANGEIWAFNRSWTHYIPISIEKLMEWLGAPCIYVWDCSAAGRLVEAYKKVADNEHSEPPNGGDGSPPSRPRFRSSLHFAACLANEDLPENPDLPADLFTSCLTSPVETALHVFALQNPRLSRFTPEQARKLPGKHSDKMTPKGHLQWVFNSVTDTIAWSVLPRPLFIKLFRSDVMIAGLFRGLLLADRIMRMYNCHPFSVPELPTTCNHPMWDTWDLAIDQCLLNMDLEKVLQEEKNKKEAENPEEEAEKHTDTQKEAKPEDVIPTKFPHHSTFFEQQLTAFEIWLDTSAFTEEPPLQLPVVLQGLRMLPCFMSLLIKLQSMRNTVFAPSCY